MEYLYIRSFPGTQKPNTVHDFFASLFIKLKLKREDLGIRGLYLNGLVWSLSLPRPTDYVIHILSPNK